MTVAPGRSWQHDRHRRARDRRRRFCAVGQSTQQTRRSGSGAYFKFQTKDGKESFINERLLSVVNYAVDIDALENDKEYKQAFKSLFRKNGDFEGS